MIGSVAVSLGVAAVLGQRIRLASSVVVAVGILVLLAPIPTAATGFLGWAVMRFMRAVAATRDDRAVEQAALEVAELVGLGLAGGLSVAAAHRVALEHCPDGVQPALRGLIRSMDQNGVVPALAADRGPTAAASGVLVTATASGAPVLPALEAHIRQEHHRRHTEAVEEARRLPIRLLIPLTLLVLPGFVLIVVGPTVIDSLARLSP